MILKRALDILAPFLMAKTCAFGNQMSTYSLDTFLLSERPNRVKKCASDHTFGMSGQSIRCSVLF